ncbi:MAG: murein L,D-transpeptidase [Epsilonproteobacteria bacterium]|nr:MAG: murein L,D-transpeptidase [Campylobacterota bacterium]
MNIPKVLLTIAMLFSLAQAKHTFKAYDDICQKEDTQECLNDKIQIKNIQIALNADKNLHLNLKIDGKWGDDTRNAVIKLQEHYKVTPAVGYVGVKTKRQLDKIKISNKVKFIKLKKKKTKAVAKLNSYEKFKKKTNLRKSFKVFKDKKLLSKANKKNTKLKVDISEQRVKLYVNNKIALCSPCTTGAKRKLEPNTRTYRDKRTPRGTFKISEKISNKHSSIFGKYYRNGKVVFKGDRRKYRGSKAKYVGASLPNWMRLTSSGIGLHASRYIKRNPGTNGCIRLPYKVAKTIFAKVGTGTQVKIVN